MISGTIIGWATLRRKAARRRTWKVFNILVAIATMINISSLTALFVPAVANAATTSWKAPTSNANIHTIVSNPSKAYAADGEDAVFDHDGQEKYGGFNISIPSGAVVTGLEVQIKAHRTSGSGELDLDVYVSADNPAGTSGWEDRRDADNFGADYTTLIVGGPNDEWGRDQWPATDLDNDSFAVRLRASFPGSLQTPNRVGVDSVAVRVNYLMPTANPGLGQSCGLDVGLIVDASDSVSSSDMTQIKEAMTTFVNAFDDTPTVFSLASFATSSNLEQGFPMTAAQAAAAINALPSSGDGHTNWDAGLAQSGDSFDPRPNPNLMVIATDGSPNRWGYPAAEPFDWNDGLEKAIERANTIKQSGTRIVVIGIGEDDTDPEFDSGDSSWNNYKLSAISGPAIATSPDAITTNTDVIKVADFDGIGDALTGYARALCPGSIRVNKQVNSDFDQQFEGGNDQANQLGFTWAVDGGSANAMGNTVVANPGSHSVNEKLAAGYGFVGWFFSDREASCDDAESFEGTTLPIMVDVEPFQNTAITLCNRLLPTASLTVNKNVDQNGDGDLEDASDVVGATNWTWDLNGGNQNFATGSTRTISPGSTTVREDVKAGYEFVGVECRVNGDPLDVDQDTSVTFRASPGAEYQCTFTNRKLVTTIDLDKTGPATIDAGDNLTYTLDWSVDGNTPATQAVITDPIPSDTTFVSADHGGAFADGTVTWDLGTKNPGDRGRVAVTVKVKSPLATGTILENTATFDSDETDAVEDTATTTVKSAPALRVSKSNNAPAFVNPNSAITYTVSVSNASSATAAAEDVTLKDVLPANLTFNDGGGTAKDFVIGDLAPGKSKTFTYVVNIDPGATAGTYTNTATADATNTDPVSDTSDIVVRVPQVLGVATPELSLEKTADPTVTNPGKTVTYTLVVSNHGDGQARNVVVTDKLPAGFSYPDGTSTKEWTYDLIAPGDAKTITYQVTVGQDVKAGNYVNTAVATADDVDPITAQATITVKVPQVLGLAETGVSASDYVLFSLGVAALTAGYVLLRRNRRELGLES